MAGNNYLIGAIAVLVVIAIVAVLVSHSSAGRTTTVQQGAQTSQQYTTQPQTTVASSSPSKHTPVLITDPPQVPPGTSALVVTYSNVKVQNSAGSWVNAQGSGRVNLLANVNGTSTVIGNANLTSSSSVKAVSFVITSATATVNGTTYNVTVPNQNIVVNVTGSTNVGANSSVVVDFYPTVVTTANANSTTYAMNPSATAVVTANANVGASAGVGSVISLNSNVNAQLRVASPSISIISAQVAASGTNTSTTVVVKDNSNSSVVVSGVALYGQQNVTANSKTSVNVGIGGIISTSAAASLNVAAALSTMSFTTSSTGSLQLASSSASWQNSGYTVSPGATATFVFSGPVTYNSGSVRARAIVGNPYKVVVFGSSGASASTTTTAT